MRYSATREGSISAALAASRAEHRRDTLSGLRRGGEALRQELRAETEQFGLGSKLAATWRLKVYDNGGRNPAILVYTRAPKIIDSYARGVTIYPRGGHRFLAVPTDDVPRKRQGNAMTPEEVENRFGRNLVFIEPGDRGFHTPSIRKNGVAYLVMNGLVTRKATARWRKASAKEQAGTTRNPRPIQSVIMFILVPLVRKPKLYDLDRVAAEAGTNIALLISGAQP